MPITITGLLLAGVPESQAAAGDEVFLFLMGRFFKTKLDKLMDKASIMSNQHKFNFLVRFRAAAGVHLLIHLSQPARARSQLDVNISNIIINWRRA